MEQDEGCSYTSVQIEAYKPLYEHASRATIGYSQEAIMSDANKFYAYRAQTRDVRLNLLYWGGISCAQAARKQTMMAQAARKR